MNICVVGSGYAGLTAAVGLASKGNCTICVDIDEEKVEKINRGEPPIYEPLMSDMLNKALQRNMLKASTNLEKAIDRSSLVFITVETPSLRDGSVDLSAVKTCTRKIGRTLEEKDEYMIVAIKSTVVPGTTEKSVIPIMEEESGAKAGEDFGVCVNPEFTREGNAISDFLNPDRIVIGELDKRSGNLLAELYSDFDSPILRTNLRTAEMIKYASNAFLATKISFINEIGNICKRLESDVYEVAEGIGMDERISPRFLRAGAGYGGSCLPKDVRALISEAESLGYDPRLLKAGIALNENQPLRMIRLLKKHLGELDGKTIGILGLSFKPGTDDIRKAPALKVMDNLLKEGAEVKAYDPRAMSNFKKCYPKVKYCEDPDDVLNSDASLILTEWEEFEDMDYSGKIVIDGRRNEGAREEADVYEGICW